MDVDGTCLSLGETLRQAGHRMRELGVAVLPVRGDDGTDRGTISRDMIVRCVAAGSDPKLMTVGDLAQMPAASRPAGAGQPAGFQRLSRSCACFAG